ncbi:hypothetical protein J421_6150 (plasmid) [Gemmatirosa kalamazoonensis]|uniref:Secreted protein n=1 Tax=Gemmatirosa kalamazoonensis TaxID=861299 RepID=W0RTS5_9BACT|nr:hypothetical protein [Gemmatirosa kalamazoonensis]AHG93685.1 hypothetical protein J421_6150 [Gemmatirosa kalamazoonensis]
MNRSPLLLVLTASGLVTAACNPFRSPFKQAPVVEVTTRDANANARWNATLVSPASLAGAVQMTGTAVMTPGSNAGNTQVSVSLANASPGGVHPWQLRRGQCGMDDGVFGLADAYKSLTVDDQGRSTSSVTVPLVMPTEGNYYVRVGASAANPETVVACGNLAAPSR